MNKFLNNITIDNCTHAKELSYALVKASDQDYIPYITDCTNDRQSLYKFQNWFVKYYSFNYHNKKFKDLMENQTNYKQYLPKEEI